MSDPAKSSKQAADSQVNEETRMRHALGLADDDAHRRPMHRREHETRGRRFVKDGEVPVVVLNGAREAAAPAPAALNRVAELEQALRAERAAHERAEQALREAQAGVERLETKLVHAEMAHAEGLAAERRAREAAELALGEATAARQALEARIAELQARLADADVRSARGAKPSGGAAASRQPGSRAQPRRRPEHAADGEPEPVKWWLPSYRAKQRKKK